MSNPFDLLLTTWKLLRNGVELELAACFIILILIKLFYLVDSSWPKNFAHRVKVFIIGVIFLLR